VKVLGRLLYAFLLISFFQLSAGNAQSADGYVFAHIRFCNPVAQDYCERSTVYGRGYGIIVLEDRHGEVARYPVLPGGRNDTEVSIMGGKLRGMLTVYSRMYRHKKVVNTDQFYVRGYITKDPVFGARYYLTSIIER